MGVVYAENGGGPYEALKAQAVAARSYSLTRAKEMGGAFGLSLKEENEQWILSMRNCTNDHVFCNPSNGCWSNVLGGEAGGVPSSQWSNCTVHSGFDATKFWKKEALAEESNIRKAVEETKGQILIDGTGKIKYTPYVNTTQNKWNNLANNGYDYFEILIDTYGTGLSLESPKYIGDYNEGSGTVTGAMINPCPKAVVTSEFGPRKAPTAGASSNHKGIDLGAAEGTDIIAPDGGTVTVAQWSDTAGNYIVIDHGNGIVTKYMHMSRTLVKKGTKVDKGQSIGKVGSTGVVTGAHLHFEIIVDGTHINPRKYITFD